METRANKVFASSIAGCLASATALAIAARVEGREAPQPLNATSHWLHGDRAAQVRRADLAHTGIGMAKHGLATVFWASLLEAWDMRRGRRGRWARAVGVSLLAAVVNYTITPKRFRPGWELVLIKAGMAFAYAAMAVGVAITSGRADR